jgi:hypothetical protein
MLTGLSYQADQGIIINRERIPRALHEASDGDAFMRADCKVLGRYRLRLLFLRIVAG